MATIHTFTGNEVIATEVPKYLNDNFSALDTETANLSKSVVKTINSKSPVNGNINITGFDSYWEAKEAVQVGDIRVPRGRENSGIVLECIKAGTTGSTQPEIPDIIGGGVTAPEVEAVMQAVEQVQTGLYAVENKVNNINTYFMPDYSAGITITSGFTAPSNGYIFFGSCGGPSNYIDTVAINGNVIPYSNYTYSAYASNYMAIQVAKGDVWSYNDRGAGLTQTFYPLKVGA